VNHDIIKLTLYSSLFTRIYMMMFIGISNMYIAESNDMMYFTKISNT
jgi:hypothetical protein